MDPLRALTVCARKGGRGGMSEKNNTKKKYVREKFHLPHCICR